MSSISMQFDELATFSSRTQSGAAWTDFLKDTPCSTKQISLGVSEDGSVVVDSTALELTMNFMDSIKIGHRVIVKRYSGSAAYTVARVGRIFAENTEYLRLRIEPFGGNA